MKRILLLSLLATSGFSQTAEWIYYNKAGDTNSAYRIKPDGTENELIMDNAGISDISEDGLKILFLDNNGIISLIDSESMDTLTLDNGGVNARFTYDENVIIYYKYMTGDPAGDQLYKYSFIDSSETLIADSLNRFIDNCIMSPDKQQFAFFKFTQGERDVVIADIQSGQTSTLATVSGDYFLGHHSYWGQDDYIYLNLPDSNDVFQLFKIHSSNGSLTQLTENESCYLLSSNDTQLEKLAFAILDTVREYWLYDFESNETSYLGDIDGSSMPVHQTWSPDNSKIAISEVWATGIYTPGPINIFDTVTDSFTTLVDSTWPPCFWVGDTGGHDCTADDGTDGVELWGTCYSIENTDTLDLHSNGLTGSIPPEIGNLTNLTTLWLWENQLTGSIPPEIGNLTNLEMLFLYNNQLTGEIPSEIGNLTNLTSLNLYSNQVTGEIPPEIGNLTSLTYLYLGGNQLIGGIPSEIGNLTNLTYLYLYNNQLTGSIPPEIGNLTNLTHLGLYGNQLTGEIPESICNLVENNCYIDISNNQLCPPYPSCVEDYVGEQDISNCEQVSIIDGISPVS